MELLNCALGFISTYRVKIYSCIAGFILGAYLVLIYGSCLFFLAILFCAAIDRERISLTSTGLAMEVYKDAGKSVILFLFRSIVLSLFFAIFVSHRQVLAYSAAIFSLLSAIYLSCGGNFEYHNTARADVSRIMEAVAERVSCETGCFAKAALHLSVDPSGAKRVVGKLERRLAVGFGLNKLMNTGSGDEETSVDLEHCVVEMGSCFFACWNTYHAYMVSLALAKQRAGVLPLGDLLKGKNDKRNMMSRDFSIDRHPTDEDGTCNSGLENRVRDPLREA